MMAIRGSTRSAPAKASYQAATHCGCWNGVDGLMSFQRATAAFQSATSSTRYPVARAIVRASSFPAWVVSTVMIAIVRLCRLGHVFGQIFGQIEKLAGLRLVEGEVDR